MDSRKHLNSMKWITEGRMAGKRIHVLTLVAVILAVGIYGEFLCIGHRPVSSGIESASGQHDHVDMGCCQTRHNDHQNHASRCASCGADNDKNPDRGGSTCLSCARSQSPSLHSRYGNSNLTAIQLPTRNVDHLHFLKR